MPPTKPTRQSNSPAAASDGVSARPGRGRPRVAEADKAVRIAITLSPAALAILDERGAGRSQEIERLIRESAKRQ